MVKLILLLLLCNLALAQVPTARGEDYGECRLRCETENTDCVNEPPVPDPDVQSAKLAFCERKLAICYAECENLRPVEPPSTEYSPNIIRR